MNAKIFRNIFVLDVLNVFNAKITIICGEFQRNTTSLIA